MSNPTRVVAGLVAAAAILGACERRTDVVAEAAAIRAADEAWVAAAQRGDVDAIVAFYAEDGAFMAPGAEAAVGREAVREAWVALLAIPGLEVTFGPTEIVVAQSGDIAYDIGTYRLAMDTPGGRAEDHGKYLVVWKKVDGQWRAAADMFNSNLPEGTE